MPINNANDIMNLPYAQWLENVLQELTKYPMRSICICAITEDGDAYRDYYQGTMLDKLTIAGIIQQDAMLDSLAANGIIDYSDEEEEEKADGEEKE